MFWNALVYFKRAMQMQYANQEIVTYYLNIEDSNPKITFYAMCIQKFKNSNPNYVIRNVIADISILKSPAKVKGFTIFFFKL